MEVIEEEGSNSNLNETQKLTESATEKQTQDQQPAKKKPKKVKTRFQRIFPWIICATSFIVQFFVLGFYKSFGPVYVKLLEPKPSGFGGNPVSTSWVASLSICTSYLSTPISFEVIRRIKFRPAMLLGASLSGLGLFISSYADSVYVLYVTFGLLFGVGSSLCYSSSLLILPHYHTKLWSLAHGIALAGNGLGGMGLSPANGALLTSINVKTAFKIMAAVSFSVLSTCAMIYETPPEKTDDDEDEDDETEDSEANSENGSVKEEKQDEEEIVEDPNEIIYHDTIWKNKPLLLFLLSTYLLNFGYYVPYVHLVKLAEDVGVSKVNAALLPGYLSLSQSIGKVFIGKVFSYESVNRVLAYQISLVVLSIATTFVPVLKTYPGLVGYAIVFGFSDGCGQATNMIIIGDLAGKALLPKAYSTFLVCSASAFVVGPPIAGFVYSATGQYSIAFFMCGAMAFSSAILLFAVTCVRDEEQVVLRKQKKERLIEERRQLKEKKEREKELEQKRKDLEKNGKISRHGRHRARRASLKASQEFNKAMLTRSWHSIDFKPHKSKSRESLRSRISNRNEPTEVRTER